jgi:hypothetical protein
MRGHLQAHHLGWIHFEDHALDHGHYRIARQGIFPGLQRGMTRGGGNQVHFADAALVLLIGGNLTGIGGPEEHRIIARYPAGIIGGVTEILDAIGGELGFFAAGDVAHPQVVIANEGGGLAVGRSCHTAAGSAPASPAPTAAALSAGNRRGIGIGGAGVPFAVALPAIAPHAERDRCRIRRKVEHLERKVRAVVLRPGSRGECRRQLVVVERRLAGAARRVHQQELGTLRRGAAIPEALIGEPRGLHCAMQHQPRGVVIHELLGAGVVCRGDGLGQARDDDGDAEDG